MYLLTCLPHDCVWVCPRVSRAWLSTWLFLVSFLSRLHPRLCIPLFVVRSTCLTAEFFISREGSNSYRYKTDDMSPGGSSAMEVFTSALCTAKVALCIYTNIVHCRPFRFDSNTDFCFCNLNPFAYDYKIVRSYCARVG